ncbi:ABC transporter permease [Roseibium sp.]|uniref:ABC transporter permease n=1 Tax=Roseibium sp. TaxID=1936156 RepID=UPI003A96BAFD
MSPGLASRLPTFVIALLLLGPIGAGLAGTLLPAAGYFPALGGNGFSTAPFQDLLSVPGLETSLTLSLSTGFISTAVSFAIVLLFTASWAGTPAFERIRRILSPLLAVPHAAAALGFAFLIAPSGFVLRLVSPWLTGFDRPPDLLIVNDPYGVSMVLGLVMKEVPFLFLMTLASMPQIRGYELLRVSCSLGYSRTTAFFKVVFPLLYSRLQLPVLAVLAYSTSVVDMAEILGPTTPAPMAPRVVDWMTDPDPSIRFRAATGAIAQLLLTALAITIWLFAAKGLLLLARRAAASGWRGRDDRIPQSLGLIGMTLPISTLVLSLCLLPLWSVTKSWWYPQTIPRTLDFGLWLDIGEHAGNHLLVSFIVGGVTTLVSAVLVVWYLEMSVGPADGASSAPKKTLQFEFLLFLPLTIPQISFLFGVQVLFTKIHLDQSVVAVCFAHLMFVLPYVYLSLKDPWRRLDARYIRLAACLGCSKIGTLWKVKLPMLLRPLIVALAIGFAVSIGQYLPTLIVGGGRVATLTTESVALASGGNRQLIGLYASLQLLLPFVAFTFADLVPSLAHRNRSYFKAN